VRDTLDYFPIAGTVLLTGGIVWVGVSTWIANKRKVGDALRGRHYHSGGIIVPDDEMPAILDRPSEYKIYPGHPLYDKNTNSRRTLPNSRPVASGPAPALPSEPAHPLSSDKVMPEQRLHRPLTADEITEVTSDTIFFAEICDLCDVIGGHERDCPRYIIETLAPPRTCTCHPDDRPPFCQYLYSASECVAAYRKAHPEIAAMWEDEGEPLAMPPQPNLGGLGNPEYKGPHYDSVLANEPRFVPYDVIGDVPADRAVSFADDGNGAVAGPLEVEHKGSEHGGTNSRREDDDETESNR
jgi:hypothetical protein